LRETIKLYNPLAPPCLKDSSQAGFDKGDCNRGSPLRRGENKRGVKIMACFSGISVQR
jgi:hypothetical protein